LREYADLPAAPIPVTTCDSTQVQRTFLVTDTFSLWAVGVGFRAEHADRDQIWAELISPAGTHVQLLSGEGSLGSNYDNYILVLADAAGGALGQVERDQDLTLPGSLEMARPDEPLNAFVGEEAAGTWTLAMCDTDAGGEDGTYLAGRLFLLPQNTARPDGTWSHSLSLPELDGVAQTLAVYGLDDAGNRTTQPWSQTLVVDNVAPTFTVTRAITEVQMTPDLTPLAVLTGTVADGGQVRRLYALVRTPEGQLHKQPVTHDGDDWSFALRTMTAGAHTLHIVAEDVAGNQTTIGPFAVEVASIPQPPSQRLYLPLLLNGAGLQTKERLYLPLVLRGISRPARAPEPTATVTPTITPAVTVTPTLTVTPTATFTPVVTSTPTPTVTPTATLTPTTTITPTLTVTPTLTPTPTQAPTPIITATATTAITPTVTVTATE
jgi:hypothetical protein